MSNIAESYSRAISSSHLEWRIEPGAIDMLAASGCIKESLGTGLLRLRAEFDSISRMPGSRNLMPRLQSASSVRARLLALVIDRGALIGDESLDMVARLLDAWCDPSCPSCTGRGQIGGYGSPQMICTACGGSKRRTMMWSREQQEFADSIAAEMEQKVDSAARRIRKLMRQD